MMGRLKDTDDFGDRMKAYEAVETGRVFNVHLPVYARIDGRAFSTFTRGMAKPFDATLIEAMAATAGSLVRHTHARIGHTQSDEISLVWQAEGETSDIFFSGKTMKMASVLASLAAATFASAIPAAWRTRLPHFDCRVFQLPSREEAANAILWRAMDARKNAISMVAQSLYSPKQLHGKNQAAMLEMIAERGVTFDAYPEGARLGTFVRRTTEFRMLSPDELAAIPEAHRPTGPVERTTIERVRMPSFNTVTNRVAVIFDAAKPYKASEP
jgi:tRNA(His) guanylyltransferase